MSHSNLVILCTHDGVFQADEVLATVVLQYLYPEVEVIRSRDERDWHRADIVYDVGGAYDPEHRWFDHHQREFRERRENGVPYSSFGLIWRHYGVDVCRAFLEANELDYVEPEELADLVDRDFVQGVDAFDCGKLVRKTFLHGSSNVTVPLPTIATLIANLNPSWVEQERGANFDIHFATAVALAHQFFMRALWSAAGRLHAMEIVRDRDRGGAILNIGTFCPWTEVVAREMQHVMLVVFRDPASNTWRVQVAPRSLGGHGNRCALPTAWGGLSSSDFKRRTRVRDAMFCHRDCWIAGAESEGGAMALAQLALNAVSL